MEKELMLEVVEPAMKDMMKEETVLWKHWKLFVDTYLRECWMP